MKTCSLEHTKLVLETVLNNLKQFPHGPIPKPEKVAGYIMTLAIDLDQCSGWDEEEGPQD